MINLIVTRHAGLVSLAVARGVVSADTPTITGNATPDEVKGREVFGILPLSLAAEAASVTEIPLNLPFEARGKDLSADEIQRFAGEPITFVVHKLPPAATIAAAVIAKFWGREQSEYASVYKEVLRELRLPPLDVEEVVESACSNYGETTPESFAATVLGFMKFRM